MPTSDATLQGRTVYIPQMTGGGARAFAAAFRSIGIDARPSPDSDARTLTLGSRYTSGEECFPELITIGDMLKVVEAPGFEAKRTAFFMPTAQGPCRFGQYRPLLQKVLRELGHDDVLVVSPTSSDGYQGLGERSNELVRTGWRALVAADALRKLMLRTRPYELEKGETDAVYDQSLDALCAAIEQPHPDHDTRLAAMVEALTRARDRFRAVPARYQPVRPLIGVVGEIFCRLNRFSNEDLLRKLEEYGAECWMSDISEWIWYTNAETRSKLRLEGRVLSLEMLGVVIKQHIQHKDEKALLGPFAADFRGYEEPHDIREVLEYAEPYLPEGKVLGEMVLSVGKGVYLHKKGADGLVDISPFSCMNGIASESVYPALSRDYDHIPIRNFYFDGTARDLDRDVGIFVELALGYMRRKKTERTLPACFGRG